MKVSVKNRSKAKKVAVNVIDSEKKDEVPTPPEDYEVNVEEDVWNDSDDNIDDLEDAISSEFDNDSEEKDKSLYMKSIAEDLAALEPEDMRKVVRAAKHLQKFLKPFKADDEDYKDTINRIREDNNGWL